MAQLTREQKRGIEIAFFTVFSVLIFVIFYALISMNGVILGNDPSVHLLKSHIFLQTGKISLENIGWTPPLFQILLAMLISFTGATDVGQQIFLVKILAVIVDWLLFLSVYLVGTKFFNKKVGVIASVLLLMCFPMFEVNAFGGYTTVLGMAFILLVLLYSSVAIERFGYIIVTFFAAFALFLSHQLAAFIALFIFPPVLLFMLIKARGAYLKVVIALAVGGGLAFFLYYFRAMIGYIDLVIEYVFFAVKTYAYQIPQVSFNSFMINFGFIFFLALVGIIVSYHVLKIRKKYLPYLILMLSFFVPLFFAESYLFGFYMPFGWFLYYLMLPMVIFASVSVVFFADKFSVFYANHKSLQKNWLKIVTVSMVIVMAVVLVFRADVVYGRIMEASVYYATTDVKALDAGVWLSHNYPNNATVVVTQIPGFWFSSFSGKNVIAQTDPTVQRNEIAESVLSLSYEMQDPQNLLRAYQAKGDTTDENYVSINDVWYRVSYSSASGNFVSFNQNGTNYKFALSDLSRDIYFNEESYPKTCGFTYSNSYIILTQTMLVQNDTYPINVSWTLCPTKSDISNVTLYISNFFDLQFTFDKAQIPQMMDWINPWDVPSKTTHGTDWAVAFFSNSSLKNSYIGLYDDKRDIAFAFKFNDLPDWGNIGALGNRQIDAVRFQYQFNQINVNQTVARQYQVLTLSKNNYPALQPSELQSLFDFKTSPFSISSRNYKDYIAQNDIQFVVYDKNQLDTKIARSKFLQLIYSNDRYVIFKILSNYNQS